MKLSYIGKTILSNKKVGHILCSLPKSLSHITYLAGHPKLTNEEIRSSFRSEIDRKKASDRKEDQTKLFTKQGALRASNRSRKDVECYGSQEKAALHVHAAVKKRYIGKLGG